MAAELKVVEPSQKVTLIHSRDKVLSSEPLPDDFKDRTLSVLREAGVEVILNDRVIEIEPVQKPSGTPLYSLTLKDGTKILTSHVIKAISHSIPSTTYLPAAALDAENYVKIVPTYVVSLAHLKFPTDSEKVEFYFLFPQLKPPLRCRRHCFLVGNQALRSSDVYGIHCRCEYPPTDASRCF